MGTVFEATVANILGAAHKSVKSLPIRHEPRAPCAQGPPFPQCQRSVRADSPARAPAFPKALLIRHNLSHGRATRGVGARPHYPWHQWTDGSPWTLMWGEDYCVTDKAFQAAVYAHAKSHQACRDHAPHRRRHDHPIHPQATALAPSIRTAAPPNPTDRFSGTRRRRALPNLALSSSRRRLRRRAAVRVLARWRSLRAGPRRLKIYRDRCPNYI